ncbi:MAG: GHKL domain-containing protein [Saprospiraceae bacterium]|nr:GHKL domain-containing protein [Saprospiraceae bacterium]
MIGMYTQLLKKRMNTQLEPTNQEFMGYITEGVSRMQHLLDDLLHYSRLGKDHADIKEVDLNNIIFVVIHNLMPVMNETKAEITTQNLPKIMASSTAMIQVFQNLVANAIKFRKKDSVPQIIIKFKENTEGYLFSIKDNGIGIKKEYAQRVFNIFERLNARQDYEGSGIGLATCKKIVENMSGRIWVRSIEGEGSTFYILFPKPKVGHRKPTKISNTKLLVDAFA